MVKRPAQAVLGLGNPGEKYRDTPHNVGHRALDLLLRSFGSQWVQQRKALVARLQCGDTTVFLIKPLTYMNSTGPVLAELSQELGFEAAALNHREIHRCKWLQQIRRSVMSITTLIRFLLGPPHTNLHAPKRIGSAGLEDGSNALVSSVTPPHTDADRAKRKIDVVLDQDTFAHLPRQQNRRCGC